jgi:hypothetical protein
MFQVQMTNLYPHCISLLTRSFPFRCVGYYGVISRYPNDKFGVAVLTNDDMYGFMIAEIIKYRIIDSALGMDPFDWNSVYVPPSAFLSSGFRTNTDA